MSFIYKLFVKSPFLLDPINMNTPSINKERLNIILLSSCVIFFFLLPLSGKIVFSTWDDYMLTLITSGAYTGNPSPYTIFEGYLYSSFIAFLYSLSNQFEWYSVVQHFLSILAFVVICWNLFKSKITPVLVYILFSVIFVVQLGILLAPTFTLCAAELSLAALVILLNCRGNIKNEIFASLLFLIGAEIRFQAVFLPLIVLVPIILYSQKKKFYYSKEFLRTLIVLACMLIGAFACRSYSNFIYNSDKDWQYYSKYNSARGYLNDNPNSIDAMKLLPDDNKKIEYDLIIHYRVNDGNIINADELTKCANYIKDNYSKSVLYNLISYIRTIIRLDGLWAFVFCVILVFELIRKHNYKLLMILFWGCLSVLLACMYMASISVAKERTIIPLLSALYFLMIWCAFQMNIRYFRYLLIAFSLIVVINWGNRIKHTFNYNTNTISEIEKVNVFLSDVHIAKLLVHHRVPIAGEAFHYSQSPIARKLVRAGWLTNAPITKVYYAGFPSYIQGLPYMYNKNNISYIKKTQSLIKGYYGIDTERVIISENEDYVVEKLVVSTQN